MKHLWVCIVGVSLMAAIVCGQGPERKTEIWEEAFHHEASGIIMPIEIAGFRIAERTAYGGGDYDGADVSVRYVDDLTKIDIYFTSVEGITFDPEDPFSNHSDAIGRVVGAIKTFAERGMYHDLDVGNSATVKTFGSNEKLPLAMAETVMTYRQSENGNEAGAVQNVKRESSVAVAFFSEYQVKIRHTFLLANNDKAVAERREKRAAFHADLRSLIAEVAIRDDVKKAIETLRENPADQGAASDVVTYAEESSLVKLTISPEQMPFFLDDEFEASNELLAAFIAGNIDEQLTTKDFQNQGAAGVAQMLSSYEILKKAGKCGVNKDLEAMLVARDSKENGSGTKAIE